MSASSYSGVLNSNAFLAKSTASTSANGTAQTITAAGIPRKRARRSS